MKAPSKKKFLRRITERVSVASGPSCGDGRELATDGGECGSTLGEVGREPEFADELNVLTWDLYTSDELHSGFEEKTGCTINEEVITTNASLNARLKTNGPETYHVTKAGNWGGERAMRNGYYKPIEVERISEVWDDIWDFTKLPQFEQNGEIYGVPCAYWAVPCIYDQGDLDDVGGSESQVSIDIRWDDTYENNLASQDAARPQVFNAALKLGIDPNDGDAILDRKEEIQRLLNEHAHLVRSFWRTADDTVDMLDNDTVDVSSDAWGGAYPKLNEQGFPVGTATYKEGTRGGVDNWHITEGTDDIHERTAYEFIRYEMQERARFLWENSGLVVPVDSIDYTPDIEAGLIPNFMTGKEASRRNFTFMHAVPEKTRQEFITMWNQAKHSSRLLGGDQ